MRPAHGLTSLGLSRRCKFKHGEINWKMEYDHQPSVYKARPLFTRPWSRSSLCKAY